MSNFLDPDSQAFPNEQGARGLTKREYFIAAALQGICANPNNQTLSAAVVQEAIWIADKTIEALNNEK